MTASALDQLIESLAEGVGVGREGLEFAGRPTLESFYPVSALATASIGIAGLAATDLRRALDLSGGDVIVDRGLADAWFGQALHPIGWELPSPWDAIAGDYRTLESDRGPGWIRLHTNAPYHRAAALRVLGVAADKAAVTRAVASWVAGELESAVVAEGGCAAELRTPAAWAAHPQGAAVASEPLLLTERTDPDAAPSPWTPTVARPLTQGSGDSASTRYRDSRRVPHFEGVASNLGRI